MRCRPRRHPLLAHVGFGLVRILGVLPEVAVVVVPGQRRRVGLQVHAHAQLAKVVGEHGGDTAEHGGLFELAEGGLEQLACLGYPGVVVGEPGVDQGALQAFDQVLEADAVGCRVPGEQRAEQALQAGVAAHEQAVAAAVLHCGGNGQADGLEPAGGLAARRMQQMAQGMGACRQGKVGVRVGGERVRQQQHLAVQHRARRRAVLRWAVEGLHARLVDAEGVQQVAERAQPGIVRRGRRARRQPFRRPRQGSPPAPAPCRVRR